MEHLLAFLVLAVLLQIAPSTWSVAAEAEAVPASHGAKTFVGQCVAEVHLAVPVQVGFHL